MKRILIVGVSSMIGSHLARRLRARHHVFGTFHRHRPRLDGVLLLRFPLEPSSPIFELVKVTRPEVIVYCAGEADDRVCRQDPVGTKFVNGEAPPLFASALRASRCRFVFLSTSKVFSGEEGQYGEEDRANPQTDYGAAKSAAESELQRYENVFIARIATAYGLGPAAFVGREAMLPRLLRQLRSGRELSLIRDEYRSFVSAEQLAEALELLALAPDPLAGTYHMSHGGRETYYDLGKTLVSAFGISEARLRGIEGREFSPEPRGSDLSLKGDKLARALGYRFDPLPQALPHLMDTLRKGAQ